MAKNLPGGTFSYTVRELLVAALAYQGNHDETHPAGEVGGVPFKAEPRRIQASIAIDEESGIVLSITSRHSSDETSCLTIAVRASDSFGGDNFKRAAWQAVYIENTMDGNPPMVSMARTLTQLDSLCGADIFGDSHNLLTANRTYQKARRAWLTAVPKGGDITSKAEVLQSGYEFAERAVSHTAIELQDIPGFDYYVHQGYDGVMVEWLDRVITD